MVGRTESEFVCPKCGTDPEGNIHCPNCGAPLANKKLISRSEWAAREQRKAERQKAREVNKERRAALQGSLADRAQPLIAWAKRFRWLLVAAVILLVAGVVTFFALPRQGEIDAHQLELEVVAMFKDEARNSGEGLPEGTDPSRLYAVCSPQGEGSEGHDLWECDIEESNPPFVEDAIGYEAGLLGYYRVVSDACWWAERRDNYNAELPEEFGPCPDFARYLEE